MSGFGTERELYGPTYTGYYLKGERCGRGKLVFPDTSSLECDFVKGEPNGEGIFKAKDGEVYEGSFKNG